MKMNLAVFAVVGLVILLNLSWIEGSLCPDKKVKCKKDQTCCSDTRGSYGCCPYGNATCCSDGSHCCPHGSDCDIAHGRCVPKPEVQGWTIIYETIPNSAESQEENTLDEDLLLDMGLNNGTLSLKQRCPDGDRKCADNYTCCPLATGGYGCCPFKNAVCCSDQVHCCPNGQKCNSKTSSCE